jgi:hypothetical protein
LSDRNTSDFARDLGHELEHGPDPEAALAQSGHRFSDKIMLNQKNPKAR